MNHLPHLIQDLALLLIIAGVTTLLFKRLKQPVVLGYLLAGFLVSPKATLFPNITDIENIRVWADIGVIFLLFTLGLEFSFKKLMRVGGPASITALIEISAMLGIGFLVGRLLGWPLMDCIFLGGIICIASTTIILRSFDELGVKHKRFAGLVFGVLIVEDLVAVVLLVLLSTIAVSRQFAGIEMLSSILKLFFFLLIWFIAGIFFIPSLLSRVQKHLSDETMLIVSIGLCLLMVLLSSLAGFSPALGAFIMGSILAETVQAERIEHLIKPVKDLFGAVFFVSVGMLIDPHVLVDYALPVLLITVILIVGKTLHVTIGAMIAGQPLKTAIYAGMSMGQIGEFSFIIATLGVTLGVTSTFLYPIAVAVSAITTFSTPYMIRLAEPLYNSIEKKLPNKWRRTLNRYSSSTQSIATVSDWKLLLRAFFMHIILFSVLILGIIVLSVNYLAPWMVRNLNNVQLASVLSAVLCLVILSPFLWALVMRKLQPQAFSNLWSNKRYRGPMIFLRLVRVGLGLIYLSILLLSFFPLYTALFCIIVLLSLATVFSKKIHRFYIRLEDRFFYNFHQREIEAAIAARQELAPWDAHIAQYELAPGSPVAGKTLEEIALREKIGVNIAMIKRGEEYTISAPDRYERIYPGDRLFVIGTDDQLEQFRKFIEPVPDALSNMKDNYELSLKKVTVKDDSSFSGQSIRTSGLRERTNGLIVGIERGGQRILNPDSVTVLQKGDVLWIVGDEKMIQNLKKEN